MNRVDYSKDFIFLRNIEIDDFDTQSYVETGHHSTGINDGRMRLPTRYDIAKFYKRNKRNPKKGYWVRKTADVMPDISDDFDWQITYTFPATLRNPKTAKGSYGGKHVTFRRLYLILCEHFNGGKYFIDDYFDTVYPHTAKPEVDLLLQDVKTELLSVAEAELEGAVATKAGTFDKRYKANRGMQARLNRYESFAKAWEADKGEEVARIIKDDIINCMMIGQLQLECITHGNSPETKKRREKAGLSSEPVFFATAQLIESIQLYVTLGGNKQWQTRQGILV